MKKAFKKTLSILFILLIMVISAPLSGLADINLPSIVDLFTLNAKAETQSGSCGNNLTWSLNEDTGVLSITGTGAMENYSESSASFPPWFNKRSSIKTVLISNGVTSIGNDAFMYCHNATDITISDTVTSIGNYAFHSCDDLTIISIPDSVKSIGLGAFERCDGLTNFYVGDNNASYYSDENGVLYNKQKTELIKYPASKINSSIIIPDGVKTIADHAFDNSIYLTNIIFPNSLKIIGESAFFSCDSLTEIIIPNNVASIGNEAFSYCENLISITVDENNTSYSSDEFGVLFNKDKTVLYYYPAGNANTSYVVPDSVMSITDKAFANSNLTSITIPDSVTSIGWAVFDNTPFKNDSLNWVNNMLYIGNHLIEAAYNISGICIVKSGTKSIASHAFFNCDSLTSVIIPNSVISIGASAFLDCDSLINVKIGNSLKIIDDYAFYTCSALTSIIIPDSVTEIGNNAFAYCGNLVNITIPDNVIIIKRDAFKNTGYYNDVSNWKNNVLYIGNCLIEANSSISGSYVIGEEIKSIASNAFMYCSELTSISVNTANEYYSNDENGVLFNKDKTNLLQYPVGKSVAIYEIPKSVLSIEEYAFAFCSNLVEVKIPDGVTKISSGLFGICTNLSQITIPKTVTYIDMMAFYDCFALTDIFYSGTLSEWSEIAIGSYNEPLYNAVIHFTEASEHSHSYLSTVTKEASCTETGIVTYACECGNSYSEDIAKIEHIDADWETVTDSTCTTRGKKIKKCTACGNITRSESIPFASHFDSNSDGLCDVCDKISNEDLVKDIYVSIATPETRTISYMESIKLYANAVNLPEGYKIKWKVEGEGVEIMPSTNGKTCTITSTSTSNVVIKAYVVDSDGNIVTDKNGKQISDSEYFYSEANLWLRIIYFFKKLFGISISTAQAFKGAI